MERTYTEVPEPRYVHGAKEVIPGGQASGKPADLTQFVEPVSGKYLHTKTVNGKVVMEWTDLPMIVAIAITNTAEVDVICAGRNFGSGNANIIAYVGDTISVEEALLTGTYYVDSEATTIDESDEISSFEIPANCTGIAFTTVAVESADDTDENTEE